MTDIELTNFQLVTLAVYYLGGETKAIDIEDIAVQASEISPEKFSWKKYPQMIDKSVVQYALKDASIPKNGPPLLSGSVKHGYLLTSVGLEWAKSYRGQSGTKVEKKFRTNSLTNKLTLERTRLETSLAFRKFLSGDLEGITDSDVQDFTRVNEYFPEHARLRRRTIIDNAVQGYPELESFWQYLKQRFG
mgnify:CR=1 FL=1